MRRGNSNSHFEKKLRKTAKNPFLGIEKYVYMGL
jgi:hypothetical protein